MLFALSFVSGADGNVLVFESENRTRRDGPLVLLLRAVAAGPAAGLGAGLRGTQDASGTDGSTTAEEGGAANNEVWKGREGKKGSSGSAAHITEGWGARGEEMKRKQWPQKPQTKQTKGRRENHQREVWETKVPSEFFFHHTVVIGTSLIGMKGGVDFLWLTARSPPVPYVLHFLTNPSVPAGGAGR
eukprot:TRINITY_DN26378_c0_g1_i2.p1 TRINITY_DN26378_c0_g1~~TRINITY_DN26378_c0_g1_i2.p1  ORF type:complete len:187 (+),score=2.80 TRINITY_DN26378_c0_g1_i2:319-879(+)